MRKHLLSLMALLSLSFFTLCKEVLSGRVVKVADGDTMNILLPDKRQMKIRLHGVDCPELGQDFGQKAKQFTAGKVFGKSVRITPMNKDRYGRTIALITLPDGKILNEELLKSGMAWHYKMYDKSAAWATLERDAKEKKLGLWSIKEPLAPWEQRKTRRMHKKYTPSVNQH